MMKSIEVDMMNVDKIELKSKFNVDVEIIESNGPGGGNPLVKVFGEENDVKEFLKDYSNDVEEFEFLAKMIY